MIGLIFLINDKILQIRLNSCMSEISVFTRIINREIPADIIWENDRIIVIADLKPVHPGHCLVITKEAYPDFASTPDEILSEVIIVAKRMGQALLSLPQYAGFNVITNNGEVAGQAVFHLHFHVIPRIKDDGYPMWHGGPESKAQQAEVCAEIKKLVADFTL